MRSTFVLSMLLLVPGLGAAQSITLDFQGLDTVVVTSSECGQVRSVNWSVAGGGGVVPCSGLLLWVTKGTCTGDGPGTNDQDLGEISSSVWASTPTGTVQIPIDNLPLFDASGGTGCGQSVVEQDMKVCAQFKYASSYLGTCSSPQTVRVSTPPIIRFDNKPPAPPTLGEVVVLDGALSVTFTHGSDVVLVRAEYRPFDSTGTASFISGGSTTVDRSSFKVEGLTNGTLYEVRARAEDAAGNLSDFSGIVTGTPIHTDGFFDRYLSSGGQETGGCAAAGGGAAAWLALAVGLIFRRRHA